MGRILSRGCRQGLIHFLVPQFLCSTWQRVSSPRPAHAHRRRAQKRSRMGALAPTEGSSLRASSTTAHLSVSGMTTSEGSCGLVHEASCHILVCGGPKAQTMMQGYASAASSEAADPFCVTAWIAIGNFGTPPPRTVIGDPSEACDRGRNRQVFLDRVLL